MKIQLPAFILSAAVAASATILFGATSARADSSFEVNGFVGATGAWYVNS